jgi:hypothetical protein
VAAVTAVVVKALFTMLPTEFLEQAVVAVQVVCTLVTSSTAEKAVADV